MSDGDAIDASRNSSSGAYAAVIERVRAVRAAVDRAALVASREPSSVALVAVSKLHPPEAIAAALSAGQKDFGESYAQEMRDKARALRATGPRWHYVGPLQRNKAKYVVGVATLIHAVDGVSLLDEIARRADNAGLVQRCLVQVNVGREPHKAGCLEEELPALVDASLARPSVRLEGLMCIPPDPRDEEDPAAASRPHFLRLAELAEAERARTGLALTELSMGMSADYAEAIACGATIVRVGTAIFGERPAKT